MGRKAVPQPLTLSEPSSATLSENTSRSAETLQVVSPTSVDSRSSPRTPRSPLSRFTPQKSQPTSLEQPSNASGSRSRALEDYDDEDDDDPKQYPPITSALYQPSDTPTRPNAPRSFRTGDSPQAAEFRPAHRDEGKVKSGFFSHFSKSSSKHLAHQHQHSLSAAGSMSRGTGAPTTSNKLVKHSGTALREVLFFILKLDLLAHCERGHPIPQAGPLFMCFCRSFHCCRAGIANFPITNRHIICRLILAKSIPLPSLKVSSFLDLDWRSRLDHILWCLDEEGQAEALRPPSPNEVKPRQQQH